MNEATIVSSLSIRGAGNFQARTFPATFQTFVDGAKGPTPGALEVSTAGLNVVLTELSVPGLFRIENLDSESFVEVGIHDGYSFFPLLEVGPGEHFIHRFSRRLGTEVPDAGTGTTGSGVVLHLRSFGASAVNVRLEAFER